MGLRPTLTALLIAGLATLAFHYGFTLAPDESVIVNDAAIAIGVFLIVYTRERPVSVSGE